MVEKRRAHEDLLEKGPPALTCDELKGIGEIEMGQEENVFTGGSNTYMQRLNRMKGHDVTGKL